MGIAGALIPLYPVSLLYISGMAISKKAHLLLCSVDDKMIMHKTVISSHVLHSSQTLWGSRSCQPAIAAFVMVIFPLNQWWSRLKRPRLWLSWDGHEKERITESLDAASYAFEQNIRLLKLQNMPFTQQGIYRALNPTTRRTIGYLLSLWCWVVSAKLQFLIKTVTKTELDTDFLWLFRAWTFFAHLNNCNKYHWGFVPIAHILTFPASY